MTSLPDDSSSDEVDAGRSTDEPAAEARDASPAAGLDADGVMESTDDAGPAELARDGALAEPAAVGVDVVE